MPLCKDRPILFRAVSNEYLILCKLLLHNMQVF